MWLECLVVEVSVVREVVSSSLLPSSWSESIWKRLEGLFVVPSDSSVSSWDDSSEMGGFIVL